MKRKRLVKVPTPSDMSVADALVVINQTIIVSMVMQKDVDPNEAYELWEENKGQILACTEILASILNQYGEEISLLRLSIPDGVGMGGYRVEDLDLRGKRDNLPF
jgi:hypothetical protein